MKGPLTEETHYYPWGLTMAGISSKALAFGEPGNKTRFNGYEEQNNEFSDGNGLDWYDYKNRFYDNQIGRFFVQDRLATEYVYYTPYQFAGNEVPNAIDLDGLEPYRPTPKQALYEGGYQISRAVAGVWDKITGFFKKTDTEIKSPVSPSSSAVVTYSRTDSYGTNFTQYLIEARAKPLDPAPSIKPYLFQHQVEETVTTKIETTKSAGPVEIETSANADGTSAAQKITVKGVAGGRANFSGTVSKDNSGKSLELELSTPGKPVSGNVKLQVNRDNKGVVSGAVSVGVTVETTTSSGSTIKTSTNLGKRL